MNANAAPARRTVTWLASYPKSGNTWLRFLAANLVFGPQDSAATLGRLVPDVHEMGSVLAPPPQPMLLKTHFACTPRMPLYEVTSGAIYIVRHPADVMVSGFHYARRSGTTVGDAETAWPRYVDEFIAHRGDPRWVAMGMGSWEQNVTSWFRDDLPFPVARVRYEDLLAAPKDAAQGLAGLLRPNASVAEIERAASDSSFERMREIEESDIRKQRVGIFYKPYLQHVINDGVRFMRGGRAGDGNTMLDDTQRVHFNEAFGSLLQALGYSSHGV
jgi:sulfotransferase family protein